MRKLLKLMPAIVFFIMIYAVMFAGIAEKDKTYSSVENRTLQLLPKVSEKRILNGKFQKKYEIYLSDQFPKRNSWVKLQSLTSRTMGKTESNSVYFGRKNYLLEKYAESDFSEKSVKKNIDALEKFVKTVSKNSNVKVMMVPSKTYTLRDYLPPFAETYNEEIFYNMLSDRLSGDVLVPVYDLLYEHKDEDIYYKTDHHWTTTGAWYGYQAYLKSCGEDTKIADSKNKLKKVSDDFLGTTYSKVNIYTKKDKIEIYEPDNKMKVIYNLGEKTDDTFYQPEFLEKKDKYSIFFGGNQALLEITGGRHDGRTLLVIKDSFANCMIPFLAEDYEKVVVADMRQLNAGMSMLIKMYKPTDVLVLYNTIQFMQDIEFAIKE